MVSTVNNSLGSSAYLKGSQLGNANTPSKNASSFKSQVSQAPAETSEASSPAETRRTDSSTETRTTRPVSNDTTQLQSRNDTETLRTEQTRGSLLDIAV